MDKKKTKRAKDGTFQDTHKPPTHQQLEDFASAGLIVEQMASLLGYSKKTLERFMQDDPSLHDALEKGRVKPVLKVAQTAYAMAVSGEVPAMTMFYLKTRGKWKETHVVENIPDQDTQDQLKSMAEELRRIAKKPND